MPSLPTIARSLYLVRRFITADVTWGDCLAATQAVVAMVGIRLALSVTSFGSVRKCLQRGVPPSRDFAPDRDAESTAVDVASMARIVGLATRAMPASSTCLHRSLTLWWLRHVGASHPSYASAYGRTTVECRLTPAWSIKGELCRSTGS